MVLEFILTDRQLVLDNPSQPDAESEIGYIQCRIELHTDVFKNTDMLIAVFKSASYFIEAEVICDNSFSSPYCFAYIPAKVFEHGGVVQMLIYKCVDGNRDYRQAQDCTNVVDIYIPPGRYVPLRTSDIVQQLANKVQELEYQITNLHIPTNVSELTNDSVYVSYLDLVDNYTSLLGYIVVDDTSAALYQNVQYQVLYDFEWFAREYRSAVGVQLGQILDIDGQNITVRSYDVVWVDQITSSVRLQAIDEGIIYVVDLQDEGEGLIGTISSSTIVIT